MYLGEKNNFNTSLKPYKDKIIHQFIKKLYFMGRYAILNYFLWNSILKEKDEATSNSQSSGELSTSWSFHILHYLHWTQASASLSRNLPYKTVSPLYFLNGTICIKTVIYVHGMPGTLETFIHSVSIHWELAVTCCYSTPGAQRVKASGFPDDWFTV